MFEDETFVTEEVAENVEQTTEENGDQVNPEDTTTEETVGEKPVKTYTEEEVNQIVGRRLARNTAKIRKEYESKYSGLENVLRAGTGEDDVEKITETFKEYYEGKGIKIPSQPQYSTREIEVLARAEAQEIIDSGLEDVTEELDRLTKLGVSGMNAKEKVMYRQLVDHHKEASQRVELEKLGVTGEVYNSPEFKAFAGKFSAATPITEIYNIYNKMQPQKPIQTAGSMKTTKNTGVKDFYTQEDIEKLTEEDLDDPQVWEAVRRSMTGGK